MSTTTSRVAPTTVSPVRSRIPRSDLAVCPPVAAPAADFSAKNHAIRARWLSSCGTRSSRSFWISGLTSVVLHLVLLVSLALWWLPLAAVPDISLVVFTGALDEELHPQELTLEPASGNAPKLNESLASLDLVDVVSLSSSADPDLAKFVEPSSASYQALTESIFGVATGRSATVFGDRAIGGSTPASTTGHPAASSAQGEFFGISTQGSRFVYVVDMSLSMRNATSRGPTRFQAATQELLRSIDNLNVDQQFFVVLFSYRTIYFLGRQSRRFEMVESTPENRTRLRRWLSQVQLAPGTDPRPGVISGLELKPDAIFLLSDGQFNGQRRNIHGLTGNPSIEAIIEQYRTSDVPIHTIAFDHEKSRARLQQIATLTGGQHRFVKP